MSWRGESGGREAAASGHPVVMVPGSYYNLSDYGIPGIRTTTWIVDGVIKYHRTFSDIVNALSTAGFQLEQMLEPLPGADILAQYPAYQKCYHKPDFLLVRAKKCCV